MSEHDELAALQTALGQLKPAPEGINLAQLMFRAGQLSARRTHWAWPCATAASMMLALALGGILWLRPVPAPTERIVQVYIQTPAKPTTPSETPFDSAGGTPALLPTASPDTERTFGANEYFRLRQEVLAQGLDALPPPAPWPAIQPSQNEERILDPLTIHLKRSLKSGDAL